MALLNPPQTLPHVMFLIYRYLLLCAENQTEDIATLRSLLAPPSLKDWQSGGGDDDAPEAKGAKQDTEAKEQRVVKFAYNALRELGVLEELDGERVRLSQGLPPLSLKRDTGEKLFRSLIRRQALDTNANDDLWMDEDDNKPIGPRDLTRALAWMLAQNVYRPLRGWKDTSEFSVQHIQQRQLGKSQRNWVFSNDTRWASFVRWAVFLGFAWKQGIPRSGQQPAYFMLVPDPTEAVRDVLPLIGSPGAKIPLHEFVANLSRVLPVLDGGVFRHSVLDRLELNNVTLPGDGELSTALAHSLLRLQDEKLVSLLNESDTDKRLFPVGTETPLPYSHLRIEPRSLEGGAT